MLLRVFVIHTCGVEVVWLLECLYLCGKRAIVFERTKDTASTPPEQVQLFTVIVYVDGLYSVYILTCTWNTNTVGCVPILLHIDNQ